MEQLNNLVLVHFFYGLSFIFLGLMLLAQFRKDVKSEINVLQHLWLLGVFSIFHGVNEWVDLVKLFYAEYLSVLTFPALTFLQLLSAVLYAFSFFLLLQYAANLITSTRPTVTWLKWVPTMILALWLNTVLVIALANRTLDVELFTIGSLWVRYLVGLTGGLLVFYMLIFQGRILTQRFPRKILIATAIFFAFNAFLSLFTAFETSIFAFFQQQLLDTLKVKDLDLPVQFFRSLCAISITFSISYSIILADAEQNRLLVSKQEELEATNQQLRDSFENLKTTQAQLIQSEKMNALGILVSGIAHEFNNLLSSIKGYAQLAKMSGDIDSIKKDLDIIEQTADRTVEITQSLLSFVRPDQKGAVFTEVNDVIQQTVLLVRSTFTKKNIKILPDLHPVPQVDLSRGELQDILLNLFINAQHALDERKGGEIRVSSQLQDGDIVLKVSDNGCGIPKENLDKIFVPFFTTKGALGGSKTPGSGLGLAVIYGIVKGHKGKIEVESEISTGTTFTMTFPVVEKDEKESAPAEEPARQEGALKGLKVLVVEDEEAIRRMMSRFLSGKDVKVQCVDNGATAIERFKAERFDMVFLDIMMPGMNGLECLGHLKEINPSIPIVIITGNLEKNLKEKVVSQGAADCIQKPFDFSQILETMERIIAGGSLHH